MKRPLQNGNIMRKINIKGSIIWLTGLSGSGKSTIANAAARELFAQGYQVTVLDGDNVRHGLNKDLGFSDEDRKENIRRIGEVAKALCRTGDDRHYGVHFSF